MFGRSAGTKRRAIEDGEMFSQYRMYRIILIVTDFLTTIGLLAFVSLLWPVIRGLGESSDTPVLLYVTVGLLWHVVFTLSRVYRLERLPSFFDHVAKITPAHLLASIALAGLLFFLHRETPRMLVIGFCSLLLPFFIVSRLIFTRSQKWHNLGRQPANVLIVGATAAGSYLARTMMREHSLVFRVAGFVDDDFPEELRLPAPILGSNEDLSQIIRDYRIEFVVVAVDSERQARLEELIGRLSGQPVRIYVVSDLLKMALVHGAVERIGDLLVIGMREPAIQGPQWVTKRVMDVLISSAGLLVLWPILAVIAILIKLDSRGPILYAPERVGQYGRLFRMYKFRTMGEGADQQQTEVAEVDEKGDILYKTAHDPRVTRVGRWLRRTSLDELPQLWNVVKGEMSLVGPRPEQPFLTQDYGKGEWQRVSVPPGITGWWQVRGRSDLPLHLNVEYDIYYVYNYSILLDIKIIFMTLGVVLKGRGAY